MNHKSRPEATFRLKAEKLNEIAKSSYVSASHYVQNMPWKIRAIKRYNNRTMPDTFDFFLQCPYKSKNSAAEDWSCFVEAELRLLSVVTNIPPRAQKLQGIFSESVREWGFSPFMAFNDILDPKLGYIQNDTITLEVHVSAQAPQGVSWWDSVKFTGFAGLKKRKEPSSINSVLQVLYITSQLNATFSFLPTGTDSEVCSSANAKAMQTVLYGLQNRSSSISTEGLPDPPQFRTIRYPNAEEYSMLFKALETLTKEVGLEDRIPKLFLGTMILHKRDNDATFISRHTKQFKSIKLAINGKKDVAESLEEFKDIDYEKGMRISQPPDILHLELDRIVYTFPTYSMHKVVHHYKFEDFIDLNPFLDEPGEKELCYYLYAVVAHTGSTESTESRNFAAYIDPKCNGRWYKFDNETVSRCSDKQAIEKNWGGPGNSHAVLLAYVRMYVRDSVIPAEDEELEVPVAEKEEYEDTLTCTICLNRPRDAHVCPHCSKLFCNGCISEWLKSKSEKHNDCPNCKVALTIDKLVKVRWFEEVEHLQQQVEDRHDGCCECGDATK